MDTTSILLANRITLLYFVELLENKPLENEFDGMILYYNLVRVELLLDNEAIGY